MKRKRMALILAVTSLLVLLLTSTIGCAGSPGQIELSAAEYDFGTVPNTTPVSQTFQVRNVGRGRLEIAGVSTSCGCTTAEIGGRRLEPGQATDLTVTYDPQAHGGATGEFMRIVYVRSDDPDIPEATLTIRVEVVNP